MPFMIHTLDKPGSTSIRDTHRADHYAYLETFQPRLIASGGLQDDEGQRFVGSTILLDVDSRAEAEAFVANDPFTIAGLTGQVTIQRWKKAFVNGVRVG